MIKEKQYLIAGGIVSIVFIYFCLWANKKVKEQEELEGQEPYYLSYNMPPFTNNTGQSPEDAPIDFGDINIGNPGGEKCSFNLDNSLVGIVPKQIVNTNIVLPQLPPYINNYVDPPPKKVTVENPYSPPDCSKKSIKDRLGEAAYLNGISLETLYTTNLRTGGGKWDDYINPRTGAKVNHIRYTPAMLCACTNGKTNYCGLYFNAGGEPRMGPTTFGPGQ